jgi:hypothetical protein
LAALLFAAGCSSGFKPGGGQAEGVGMIHAALSGLPDGIASVRVDVLSNGITVTSKTVPTAAAGSPPPLADAFFVLAPGMYTVVATPLDAGGKALDQCQPAMTSAIVSPSITTEVILVLHCAGTPNGGLDVVITADQPPLITGLEFDPSKFTQVCEPVKITVEATSPDGMSVDLTYDWAIVSSPQNDTGQPAPGSPGELVPKGDTALFDTRAAGDFTLKVVVSDASGSASLSFPIHVASGDACAPVVPRDNTGATKGRLTISGRVLDDRKVPIAGAQLTLTGAVQAVRYSDLTGHYVFHVDPGAYSLAARSDCEVIPSAVNFGVISTNVTQDFVSAGFGCVQAAQTNVSPVGSIVTLTRGTDVLGGIVTAIEPRADGAAALARLQQINGANAMPATNITVNGFSGIERQVIVPLKGAVDPDFLGAQGGDEPVLGLTTAVAMGATVVRFEASLPDDADAATVQIFSASHHNTIFDGVDALHGAPLPTRSTGVTPPAAPPPVSNDELFPSRLAANVGELQIAASDTQNAVVYATQSGALFRSTNNGLSVQPVNVSALAGRNFGDPTITIGAPDPSLPTPGTQAFYYAQITTTSAGAMNQALQVWKSTDGGQNFVSPGGGGNIIPIDCAAAGSGCTTPDQPMIAADRVNQAISPMTGLGADQVYLVWRVFGSPTAFGANGRTVAISCSADGGVTWSPPNTSSISAIGDDYPRISVGADGTVFVAFESVGFDIPEGFRDSVALHAFSSCATGLVPLTASGFPVGVSPRDSHLAENCQPGLDRCADANYMVSGDETNARNVYVTYTRSNNAGGDDVHVAQSTNGGLNFVSDLVVNSTPKGARYLPWICASRGRPFVSWYDRRDATAGATDLTAYFQASMTPGMSGIAIASGGDFNVSGVDDPECLAGFSSGVRNSFDETGCTDLPAGPIFGGVCPLSMTPCDFRNPVCPLPPEFCVPGGGNPNYGDYNGAACAQGRMQLAWASTTPPPGLACVADSGPCTMAAQCCSGACTSGMCTAPAACFGGGVCNCANAGVCIANGAACATSNQCASGNCQGGVCMRDVALYTTSSACSTAPCRALKVVLSMFNFHTTGFNLGDHNPNFHTPNGADGSGNVTLTCQPLGDGVNTILATSVSTQTQLGCFDGYGFYASLTCSGTGTPGSLEVNGTIEFSISGSCTTNDRTVTQLVPVGPLPGPSSTGDLNVCYAGFDLSNPPPCQRQQLAAHAVASNIPSP